jgi:hypothetical protein
MSKELTVLDAFVGFDADFRLVACLSLVKGYIREFVSNASNASSVKKALQS